MTPFWLIPIGLSFAAIGLWELARTARDAVRDESSHTWPTTAGQIVTAGVETTDSGIPFLDRHQPTVEYRYTVDGLPYTGYRIAFGERQFVTEAGAEARIERYPAGAVVYVAHHPTRPDLAVLEPGAGAGVRAARVVIGIIVLAFGIYLAYQGKVR